jgi:hypothetical protein
MTDANENELRLVTCASKIKQLESDLARGGPERLDFHRQIGVQLRRAKEIALNNFVKWSDETFGRGPQWRATHMTVARRWDDITEARTWAEGEGSKLATLYSVDGALELLDAWAAATGHESSKPKRSLPKKAKTSAADLCLKQSADEREIAVLKLQLEQQSNEAAHFRIELPLEIRSEARALAVRACALDAQAERQLRDIAREHRWLFRSLCEDLGGEETRGRLDDALADVAVRAVGGFDVSLNTHETDAFEPYWAPHVLIIAPARRLKLLHEDFREWFPPGDETPRPVRMSKFDGEARGIAYALKPDFSRRISLEPRLLADGSRSTFGTRGKPIGGASRVELALALDRAGLDGRLFMHGYQLVTSGGRRRDCPTHVIAGQSQPTSRSARSDALAKVTEPSSHPTQ